MINVDAINDQLQQSATAQGAWNVLSGVSMPVLRELADLNDIDPHGMRRERITTLLVASVHGTRDAGVERVARMLGQRLNIVS